MNIKHACLCLFLFAAFSAPALAAPNIGAARIANAYTGYHGEYEEDAPYEIMEDKSVGLQCVKIRHAAGEPGVYRLQGGWYYEDLMREICDVKSGADIALKKGETGVFCAPKCAKLEKADPERLVVFYGDVRLVEDMY